MGPRDNSTTGGGAKAHEHGSRSTVSDWFYLKPLVFHDRVAEAHENELFIGFVFFMFVDDHCSDTCSIIHIY